MATPASNPSLVVLCNFGLPFHFICVLLSIVHSYFINKKINKNKIIIIIIIHVSPMLCTCAYHICVDGQGYDQSRMDCATTSAASRRFAKSSCVNFTPGDPTARNGSRGHLCSNPERALFPPLRRFQDGY